MEDNHDRLLYSENNNVSDKYYSMAEHSAVVRVIQI